MDDQVGAGSIPAPAQNAIARYRATLAYDGTGYFGFQRQAQGTRTVQSAVEQAIAAVTGQMVTITGAGRTDTGVHATGQVIAFDVGWKHSADTLLSAINAVLPDDIALQDLSVLGEVLPGERGFHPRFDAVSRLYNYTVYVAPVREPLLRKRAWHVIAPLNAEAMQQAAGLLLGTHDFAAFGKPPRGENTVRTVMRSAWTREDQLLVYRVQANAFLQHMVRRIVALLVAVGRGALTVQGFEVLFLSGKLASGTPLAPAHGLVLEKVEYPSVRRS